MRRRDRHKSHKHHLRKGHASKKKSTGGHQKEEILGEVLGTGKSLQDILGLPSEGVLEIFQDGLECLQLHRTDDAFQIFNFLTRMNPFIADFWIAKGITEQAREDPTAALSCFLVAQTMDPSRPDAYLNAIECCIQLKKYKQAASIAKFAHHFIHRHPRQEGVQAFLEELEGMEARIKWEKEQTLVNKSS